jgi:hypothetical protein
MRRLTLTAAPCFVQALAVRAAAHGPEPHIAWHATPWRSLLAEVVLNPATDDEALLVPGSTSRRVALRSAGYPRLSREFAAFLQTHLDRGLAASRRTPSSISCEPQRVPRLRRALRTPPSH